MSLKVWLPLDGNVDNKGSHNATITLSGATVDTAGKIGSCYSFDGTDDYIQLSNFTPNGWPEFSLTAWVYPTADFNALFLIRGSGAHRINVNANGFVFRDTNNSTQRKFQFSPTIPLNTWTHIACVYKRGEVWLYQNGVLSVHDSSYYNSSSTLLNDMNEIRIARQQSTSGNVYYTGKINDFRIYDHALSTAEVHELAQGLVRHYKLDAENLINKNTLTADNYINASGGLKGTSNWYASDYIPVFYGKTYQTFDLSHGGSSTCVALYNSSKVFKRSITIVANENLTITPNADESYIRLSIRNIGGELAIAKFVEVGNIIDSSGYGKHGTIVGTTTLEIGSPRYECATHMNNTGTSNHIEADPLPLSTQTVSLWTNADRTTGQVIFVDKETDMEIGFLSGACSVRSKGNAYLFTISSSYNQSQFNHIAITKNDSTYRVFVNGTEATQNTTSKYFRHDVNKLYFLNRNYNSSYAANASISDFRAYVTLLSEDDIKELYRVGLKIDKRSGMHAYELQEGQNQLRPTAQGLLQCEHLEEDEKASFYKDKHIEASQIIEM